MPECATPLISPLVYCLCIGRPAQLVSQRVCDVLKLQRRICAIPAENAERWKIARRLMKMREGNFTLIRRFFTKSGNEEQIVQLPTLRIASVGRVAFFQNEMPEDAAQHNDREFFLFELDIENAPRLARLQGAK